MEGKNLKLNWLIQFLVTNVVCNLLSNHSLNLYIWLYGKMYLLLAVYNIQVQKKIMFENRKKCNVYKGHHRQFLVNLYHHKEFQNIDMMKDLYNNDIFNRGKVY